MKTRHTCSHVLARSTATKVSQLHISYIIFYKEREKDKIEGERERRERGRGGRYREEKG